MIEFKTTKEPTVKVNDRLYMVRLHNEEMLLADVYGGSRKDAELKAELLSAAPLSDTPFAPNLSSSMKSYEVRFSDNTRNYE